MSAREVEVSVAASGVRADADAFEAADVDAVPLRGDRAAIDPGAALAAYQGAPVNHAVHPQAAPQVQLAQATNSYDETAELRRENDERLEEVHAQAEADAAAEQKQKDEQAQADEEAREREDHEREEQAQKDRAEEEAREAADHAGAGAEGTHEG